MFEGFDDGQEFQVIDVIVLFVTSRSVCECLVFDNALTHRPVSLSQNQYHVICTYMTPS